MKPDASYSTVERNAYAVLKNTKVAPVIREAHELAKKRTDNLISYSKTPQKTAVFFKARS